MEADGLTDNNGIPKSIQNKAIVSCMADMNLPGFFTLIFPVLKRIDSKLRFQVLNNNWLKDIAINQL
jgi:hypothetical protein